MPTETLMNDPYAALYFNANFRENTHRAGWVAYRGELVLKEGEIADAQGRRKPPEHVLKQAVLLTAGRQIQLLAGSLDALQDFPHVLDRFGAGIGPHSRIVLFTVNIPQAFLYPVSGTRVAFIPMVQGMVWNELIDLVALEKSDFKGQSSADKVLTLHTALAGHDFRLPETHLDEALKTTNAARRENHGAI